MSLQAGVHFTLCGGSLCNLGTKKHHDLYLAKMDTLEERGCFAMTELGHGSNVMGIETTVRHTALMPFCAAPSYTGEPDTSGDEP